jgi:hypothetical protein
MANNRYANLSFPELMILQHAHKQAANMPTNPFMSVYELADKERIPLKVVKGAVAAGVKAYGKNNNGEAQWEKEVRMKAAIKKALTNPQNTGAKPLPMGFTGTVNPLSAIKARKTRKAKKTRRNRSRSRRT